MDKKELKAKLLSRVELSKVYPRCWNWTGTIKKNGYGVFNLDKKEFLAHRASYEVYHGKIPEDMQTHHICRNRVCINPGHVLCVSHADHNRISANYGARSGERNGMCKHSAEKVKAVRRDAKAGVPAKKLSEIYDIPQSTLSQILSGKSRIRG